MTILLLIVVQAAALPGLPTPAGPSLSVVRSCAQADATDPDTVVVCGRRRDYRLPLPLDRADGDPDAHVPGDVPTAAAALAPTGRCGIFAGERSCGKKEAARYGYGAGRDPITVMTRLATRLIDPDAE